MRDSRRARQAGFRWAVAVALVAVGAAGCSSGSSQSARGAGSSGGVRAASPSVTESASTLTSTSTSVSASTAAQAPPAAIPFTCTDQQLISTLTALIGGEDLNTSISTGAGKDSLSCAWGTSTSDHLLDVSIDSASSVSTPAGSFQPVVLPALTAIGATAESGTTAFDVGSHSIYISTFVVTTADQRAITVSYTGNTRQDQQIADAAVAIAQRLHG